MRQGEGAIGSVSKLWLMLKNPYVEAAKLALMVTLRFGPPSSMNVFLTIVTGVVALVTLKVIAPHGLKAKRL
jgi:hypothetical protein